ncbi:MAG: hypothetical protein B6I20_05620 [Bacteroidetes bacterium 4572_117]|nr:MAG: hypothetical protein B6I20_05620 [Bacteroidetes bacterium 4572_117]
MVFITTDDFNRKFSEDIREQITESDTTILDDAEADAMAIVQDAFSQTYDLDAEFAETDGDRHKNLIRWMLNLMVYFIYERVPDNQVPERVVKNYDDTIAEIKGIESGKKNTTLAKIVDVDSGKTNTVFRWGSNTKRSHKP